MNELDFLNALERRFEAEKTPGWRTPKLRTEREYQARQALMLLGELRWRIQMFEEAEKQGAGNGTNKTQER